MQIKNFGSFTQYRFENYILYKNENNQDWNDMQMGLLGEPPLVELGNQGQYIDGLHDLYAIVDIHTNLITNIDKDPSKLVPHDKIVLGLDGEDAFLVTVGLQYKDGVISEAPFVEQPYKLMKTTPWRRMTKEEAEQAFAALQLTDARERAIYDAATYIGSDDELFPMLMTILTELFGAPRAKELLAEES